MYKKKKDFFYSTAASAQEVVLSRGHFYGELYFTSCKSFAGKIPFWSDHAERLSAHWQIIAARSMPEQELFLFFLDLHLVLNQILDIFPHAYIRIMQWGNFPAGQNPGWQKRGSKWSWAVWAYPLPTPREYFLSLASCPLLIPQKVKTSQSQRASGKHADYTAKIQHHRQFQTDCDLVAIDSNAGVLEAMSGNIFILKKGEWFTPRVQNKRSPLFLPGILRKNFLRFLRRNHFIVHEQKLTLHDLAQAEEILLTNTVRGLITVKALWLQGKKQKKSTASIQKIRTEFLNYLLKKDFLG